MNHQIGDVFQINEKHAGPGWVGVFVMADKIYGCGIRGRVAWPLEREQQSVSYIRLAWWEIDYIGKAQLIPMDLQKTPS